MGGFQAFPIEKQVLVYRDEGVGATPFFQTFKSLRETFNSKLIEIKAVDHRYLTFQNWEKRAKLLVFPGGRDRPYHKLLKGLANQKIVRFIDEGGSFLGICAGGYYGSSYVEFEKGEKLEVCEKRELAFFPGKAIGPAYGKGKFRYEKMSGAEAANIEWGDENCSVYFNGGCYFEKPENFSNVSVIAKYLDLPNKPAAVIECSFGKGRAILSGVHPEYSFHSLNFQDNCAQRIYSKIFKSEKIREKFWKHILYLLLPEN